MTCNAVVGNRDDHPRNHGLLHDGTGWRLSKAFDITPPPTFTARNLLGSAPHFGLDLHDAATWLGHAARRVAEQWQPTLQSVGVPAGHTTPFEPAFALASEWANAPQRLDEAITDIEQTQRAGRKRRKGI
ncbi:hypothetical protein GCM10028785_22180 [Hydrogenophaga soli]